MENLDNYNLKKVILTEPSQILEGLTVAGEVKLEGSFQSITISGMGGSALQDDILRIFIENLTPKGGKRLAVHCNRYYNLPLAAYENSLNFVCSYSGNTEETISALNECIENNLPCIGMSHGGEVERICQEKGVTHIELPYPFDGFQPRMGIGYIVFIMLKVLANMGLVELDGKFLEQLTARLEKSVIDLEEQGRQLAQKLKGKTPVVYSTDKFKSLARIWKIKFNENSKTPAFWNYFPELNHNEMVGYTLPQADFFFVMLRDLDDHSQNIKRFEVTMNLMKEKGLAGEIIDIEGKDDFEKVFNCLYLGDWASYYLALEHKIDPSPVAMVEKFKKLI